MLAFLNIIKSMYFRFIFGILMKVNKILSITMNNYFHIEGIQTFYFSTIFDIIKFKNKLKKYQLNDWGQSTFMVKEIVRDVFFLSQKSEPATKADLSVGYDLMDTLRANRERCVGMAANMIGVKKKIIIVNMGMVDVVMFNPTMIKKDTPYETEEGCLSLDGVRPTTRYQNIEVEYYDFAWKKQRMKMTGWTAQICQHEMDHLMGRII